MNNEYTGLSDRPSKDGGHYSIRRRTGIIRSIIRLLDAYLMGYDVFISYSWHGGRTYAEKLVAALHAKRYRCFLDSSEYQVGSDLSRDAQRAVRVSSAAAIVVTPASLQSHHVRHEIELFDESDKPLVPIDINQTLYVPRMRVDGSEEWILSPTVSALLSSVGATERAEMLATIARISRDKRIQISETQTDVPSRTTVEALCKRFGFSRRVTRRLRVISAACIVFALLTGIAAWLWSVATYQKSVAVERLVRICVANGERLLSQEDLPGALLWFANPLSVHPKDEDVDRQRIAAVVDCFPRVLNLLPHATMVKELRLDEKGRKLATVGEDDSLLSWDLDTGVATRPPLKVAGEIKEATFSSNGSAVVVIVPKPMTDKEFLQSLAQFGEGGLPPATDPKALSELEEIFEKLDPQLEARAYESTSGKLIDALTFKAGNTPSIWPNPNGTFVIAGSSTMPMGGTMSSLTTIWRPGNSRASIPIPGAEFSLVAFSPDGKTILGGDYNGTWRLVSSEGKVLQTGRPTLAAQDNLSEIALCPTGRHFATATDSGRVSLWGAHTGKVIIEEMESGKGGNRDLHALVFSPDGRWLAGAIGFLGEKTVHVWDTSSGRLALNIELSEPGKSVSFSPSGRYLLVTTEKYGSREGEARVWDIGTGLAASPRIASVYMAQWGPGPNTIITAGSDMTVKVWELFHQTAPILSLAQQELLRQGRVSNDGQVLAAKIGGGLQTFDMSCFDHGDFSVQRPQISWDHDQFTMNQDNSLAVLAENLHSSAYDLKNRSRLPDFLHKNSKGWTGIVHIQSVEISSDGHTALIAGGDGSENVDTGRILTWDTMNGKAMPGTLTHDAFVTYATFSPDGRLIVSTSRDGTARIWEVASGKMLQKLVHGTPVEYASISNDGKLVATAAADGLTRLWNVATGQECGKPMRHEGAVVFVSFIPDGSSLLTISNLLDGETAVARLWDAATQEAKGAPAVLGVIRGTCKAGFSPDGRFILTPYGERGFRVWSAATMEGVTAGLESGSEYGRSGSENLFLPRQRSLVVSQNTKGLPLMLGIGNGNAAKTHAVVPWSLREDTRPAEEIVRELEVIASRRIDSTGALVLLTPDELKALWEETAPHQEGLRELPSAWFRREAEECLQVREWFGAVWNIDNFLKLETNNAEASLQLDRGRALAELERWPEAALAFTRARSLGASEAVTLPNMARLWAASGERVKQQQLVGLLIIEAQKSDEATIHTDFLRAAAVSPLLTATSDLKTAQQIEEADLRKTGKPDEKERERDVLAAILYRSGDFSGALAQLDQLKRENLLMKDSLHFSAMTKWQLGDRIGAQTDLAEAQAEMKRYAANRRDEDGNYADSLYWYEWADLSALDAEASKLIGSSHTD